MNVRTSDSIAKLAPALVKAHREAKNAKRDSENPHFRSKYADLESLRDACFPAFHANDLCVLQMPGYESGIVTLTTRVVHASGEWIETDAGAPSPKLDPQGVGSAITYLRRYALAAMAGIAPEDDDGNAASVGERREAAPARPASPARAATPTPPATGTPSCPECGGAMWDNREGKNNPKAPDYKCKDKNCDGVVWPPKPGQPPAALRDAFDLEPVELPR